MTAAASAAWNMRGNLQSRQHVSWRDAVDADVCVGPLDSQRRGQVADGCFGRVVGSVDASCQQLSSGPSRLPQIRKKASTHPARDFVLLAMTTPLREGCDPASAASQSGPERLFPNCTCSRQLMKRPLGPMCHGKPCEPMTPKSAQSDEELRPPSRTGSGSKKYLRL